MVFSLKMLRWRGQICQREKKNEKRLWVQAMLSAESERLSFRLEKIAPHAIIAAFCRINKHSSIVERRRFACVGGSDQNPRIHQRGRDELCLRRESIPKRLVRSSETTIVHILIYGEEGRIIYGECTRRGDGRWPARCSLSVERSKNVGGH